MNLEDRFDFHAHLVKNKTVRPWPVGFGVIGSVANEMGRDISKFTVPSDQKLRDDASGKEWLGIYVLTLQIWLLAVGVIIRCRYRK